MKKNTLGLIFTILLLVLLFPQASASQATEPIGEVQKVSGKVFAVRQGNIFWLEKKDELFISDVIVSDKESSIQAMFKDGSVFTMAENSVMKLAELVYDKDDEENNGLGFDMATGVFRFLTGKIADGNPEKFEMNTPLGTLGIRGTEGGLIVEAANPKKHSQLLQDIFSKVQKKQGVTRSSLNALFQSGARRQTIAHFQGSVRTDMQFKDFKGKVTQIGLGKSLSVSGDSGSGAPQPITPDVRNSFKPAKMNSKANTPRQYRSVFNGYNHNLGASVAGFCSPGTGSNEPNSVEQQSGSSAPSGAGHGGGFAVAGP